MYCLGFRVLVVYREGKLKAWLTRTLPQVLPIVAGLCVVKLTKASESEELFARWRLVFFIDWGQEALDLGSLVANDEAAEAVLGNILVFHVQFVYKLSAVRYELLTALFTLFSLVFTKIFLH